LLFHRHIQDGILRVKSVRRSASCCGGNPSNPVHRNPAYDG
jgi:hypothetical protein